ncbi:hypothetical protein [Massilia glaciei]|uniref:hypothetical protein n=1 Tax=Massilia glaciei TaxID=1524097 RepID=UPI0011B28299|nr:hypothetical protein [Massilia glaciei]
MLNISIDSEHEMADAFPALFNAAPMAELTASIEGNQGRKRGCWQGPDPVLKWVGNRFARTWV